MALTEAVQASRLAGLRALRDLLAQQLEVCESSRDVAALSRQLTDVLEQIEVCEKAAPEQKGTPLDELARRRSAGKPGASGRSRPARGDVVAR